MDSAKVGIVAIWGRLKFQLDILTIRSWWHRNSFFYDAFQKKGLSAGWVTVIAFKQLCVSSHDSAENFWSKKQQLYVFPKIISANTTPSFSHLWKLYEAKGNKSLTYARSASLGFVGWYAQDMFRINPNNGTALLLISTNGICWIWLYCGPHQVKTSEESSIFSYSAGSENVIFIHCFPPLLHLKHLFNDLYAIPPYIL